MHYLEVIIEHEKDENGEPIKVSFDQMGIVSPRLKKAFMECLSYNYWGNSVMERRKTKLFIYGYKTQVSFSYASTIRNVYAMIQKYATLS